MTIEQTIAEKVRILSPEKQQEVLAFIEFLQTDEWDYLYKGRFQQLQQQVRTGIDEADRGEVVDAEVVFQGLRQRLQQRRAQAEQ
jgi:hypothetical protein